MYGEREEGEYVMAKRWAVTRWMVFVSVSSRRGEVGVKSSHVMPAVGAMKAVRKEYAL